MAKKKGNGNGGFQDGLATLKLIDKQSYDDFHNEVIAMCETTKNVITATEFVLATWKTEDKSIPKVDIHVFANVTVKFPNHTGGWTHGEVGHD